MTTAATKTLAPRPPGRRNLAIGLILLACLAVAALLGWHFASPDLSRFAAAAEKIQSGQLKGDSNGVVDLSRAFPGLTINDQAMTSSKSNQQLIFFPTYRGKGTEVAGLLYASQGLSDQDTYSPGYAMAITHRLIDVALQHRLTVFKRLNDHWYRVSRQY